MECWQKMGITAVTPISNATVSTCYVSPPLLRNLACNTFYEPIKAEEGGGVHTFTGSDLLCADIIVDRAAEGLETAVKNACFGLLDRYFHIHWHKVSDRRQIQHPFCHAPPDRFIGPRPGSHVAHFLS